MNLTYEVVENGYIILNDGVKWIEQKGYIPYPAETLEQSAKLHIAEILKNNEESKSQTQTNEELQKEIKQLKEQLQALQQVFEVNNLLETK